jgi:hypothetical protein
MCRQSGGFSFMATPFFVLDWRIETVHGYIALRALPEASYPGFRLLGVFHISTVDNIVTSHA